MKSSAAVYVLQSPNGRLVPKTVACERANAWEIAFQYIYTVDPEFGRKYWKKWDASQRAARRRGWRVVRVELVPTT